jgi:hypothetical protein
MKSFMKTLERIGSRMIGLYDFTSSAGFPGLSIVTIWDTFHCPGKYPVRKMLLYMYVIADNPISGSFLRISPVMRLVT